MASAKFLKKVLRFLFLAQSLIPHLTLSEQVSVPEYLLSNLSSRILREIEKLPESEFRYDSKVIEIVPKTTSNNTLHFKFIGNEITQVNNSLQGDLVIPKLGNNTHSSLILLEFHKVIIPKSWKVFRNGLLVLWRSMRSLRDFPNIWNAAVVHPRVDKPFYFEWDFLDPANNPSFLNDDALLGQLSLCMQRETMLRNWRTSSTDLQASPQDNEVEHRSYRTKRGLFSLYRPLHHAPIVASIVTVDDESSSYQNNRSHSHSLALASAMVMNTSTVKNSEATAINRIGGNAVAIARNRGHGNATSNSLVNGTGSRNNTSNAVSIAETAQGGMASSRSLFVGYQGQAQSESFEASDPESFKKGVDNTFENVPHHIPRNPTARRKRRSQPDDLLHLNWNRRMKDTCNKLMDENARFSLTSGQRKPSPEELRNLTNKFLFQVYTSLTNASANDSHEQEYTLRRIFVDSERNAMMNQFEEHRVKLSRILTPVIQRRVKTLLLILMKHEKIHDENSQLMPREMQLLKALLRILSF